MNLFGKLLFDTVSEWFHTRFIDANTPTIASIVLLLPFTMRRNAADAAPRQGILATGYGWLVWICMKGMYALSAAWTFKMWSLFDLAVVHANNAYSDALMGTSQQKCEGVLAAAQRVLCNQYDATLSRWYWNGVRSEMTKLVPSCLFMECSQIWTEITNSYAAWAIWTVVFLVVVVWTVQFIRWIANKMINITTHAGIVAVQQDQDYYHAHLAPSIQHVIDEPLRINRYAASYNNRPALMAHESARQRRYSE
jgi:hypothetical protein